MFEGTKTVFNTEIFYCDIFTNVLKLRVYLCQILTVITETFTVWALEPVYMILLSRDRTFIKILLVL
jgi:hypothetical protein